MKRRSNEDEQNVQNSRTSSRPAQRYEPPRLTRYGSLAELTRSGTGTVMEMTGPSNRFA